MKKEIIAGLASGVGLLIFYFVVMRLASGSTAATIDQFEKLFVWMIALSVSFGFQIGLFVHLKNKSKKIVAASGSTSTFAMIACCAHHTIDILPLAGLSTIAVFLSQYQTYFLSLAIISNITGIIYLLKHENKIFT